MLSVMCSMERDLGERLTEAASGTTGPLSPAELSAVRRYQALDRTYQLVSAVLTGRLSPDDLTAEQSAAVLGIVDGLDAATGRWELPEPVRAYRGQRSIVRLFGDLPPVGAEIEAESFLSTTIYREVAVEEFTAALLDESLHRAPPSMWDATVGTRGNNR